MRPRAFKRRALPSLVLGVCCCVGAGVGPGPAKHGAFARTNATALRTARKLFRVLVVARRSLFVAPPVSKGSSSPRPSTAIELRSKRPKGLLSPTLSSRAGEGEVLRGCIRLAHQLKKARLRRPLLLW